MKKHLFISVCAICFAFGVSAKYTIYKAGDGQVPNGDCLEMMCEHGCVEDENALNGTCCPNDGTNGSACTIGACCKSGSCNNGKCGCPSGSTAYTKLDNTIGCCNSTTHVLNDIESSDKKVCCPAETPKWDGINCVTSCPTLYGGFDTGAMTRPGSSIYLAHTIGPYECDYEVIVTGFGVDDFFCIQGSGMACAEKDEKVLGKNLRNFWHNYSPNNNNTTDNSGIQIKKDKDLSVYILPKGKRIDIYEVNRKLAAGGGTNASLGINYMLKPITTGNVSESCGNDWVVQEPSCASLACSSKFNLKADDGTTKVCCKDSYMVIDSIQNVDFYGKNNGKQYGCCPSNRYAKLTNTWYYNNQAIKSQTKEVCCPIGTATIDGGCCPVTNVVEDPSAAPTYRRCTTTPQPYPVSWDQPSVDAACPTGKGCSGGCKIGNQCCPWSRYVMWKLSINGTTKTQQLCCPEGQGNTCRPAAFGSLSVS